jgi:hypothetical protein
MKNYLPLARKNLVFFTGGKMLRGAFPELDPEILRFAQDDGRRGQDESLGLFARLSLFLILSFGHSDLKPKSAFFNS